MSHLPFSKISILTPSYNSGEFLERAVRSVLAQEDPNWEHIVMDGGSTDETHSILKKFPHLAVTIEADTGQSDAMNKAFRASSGDIIVYLNADDWFEPGVFKHVRSLFHKNSGLDMIIGNLYIRVSGSEEVRLVVPVKNYRKILMHYKYRYPLNPVCYFYLRKVQNMVGDFPLSLHYAMDYHFLLNATKCRSIIETDFVMGTFYQTGFNKTSTGSSTESAQTVAVDHLRQCDLSSRFFYTICWAWYHYILGFRERLGAPVRWVVYFIFFRRKIPLKEFKILGFRASYRKYYGG